MKIIIEGAGDVGSHLAKMLAHEGGDITVIDCDEERISKLSATADVAADIYNYYFASQRQISSAKGAGEMVP